MPFFLFFLLKNFAICKIIRIFVVSNKIKIMGFHRTSATRNMRQTHAHLDRKENGDVYAIFKLGFTKDASRFEYCFIGANVGTLTYDGTVINKHPKFKGIDSFEGWCRKYCAEHDL